MRLNIVLLLLPLLALTACGDDAPPPAALGEACDASLDKPCESGSCVDDGEGTDRCLSSSGGTCDPAADTSHCLAELTCAELEDGSHACYAPVFIEGIVRDSTDDTAIEGAHIIGLDEQKFAVTDVAVSDAEGNYSLAVPVVRNSEGAPVDTSFTLRADAQDYQTFPSGLRTALPINTSIAQRMEGQDEDGWTISGTPTEVVLIPLPANAQGNPSIAGSVLAEDNHAGVLVVAAGADRAYSAVTDREGDYTIFNVPAGDYEVRGYAAGLQLVPEGATVGSDPVEDVDLGVSDEVTATLSGDVNIVNAPGGAQTSVVLVVADTFDDTFVRGEVPPGLRAPRSGAPDVEGAWTIEGVPAGEYVVLAAFENDDLVRDPDQNIAGTDFVTVTIDPAAGDTDVSLADSFKITEALAVVSPGAERPEMVSAAPTLEWADDSSEDFYTVEVYNAYGDLVWDNDGQQVDRVTGSDTVSIDYGGPTEPGMYYQFRVKSRKGDSPISATEDLRGVFYFE
jgi:hypothetical protein